MSKGTLCIGTGLISGRTNESNEFTVYTERGGLHGVSVSVEFSVMKIINHPFDNQ